MRLFALVAILCARGSMGQTTYCANHDTCSEYNSYCSTAQEWSVGVPAFSICLPCEQYEAPYSGVSC